MVVHIPKCTWHGETYIFFDFWVILFFQLKVGEVHSYNARLSDLVKPEWQAISLWFHFSPDAVSSQVHHKSLSLGEVLDGDRMAQSLYHIGFRENVEKKTLCQLTLSEKQVRELGVAVYSSSAVLLAVCNDDQMAKFLRWKINASGGYITNYWYQNGIVG